MSGAHEYVRAGAISQEISFHFHVSENDALHYADDNVYAPSPDVNENGYGLNGKSLKLQKSIGQWKLHEPTEMNP